MKLDYDCIRDVLLICEDKLQLTSNLSWEIMNLSTFCSFLSKYSREEIAYTLILLDEAGYVDCQVVESDWNIIDIRVSRLTYCGHEFLSSIHSGSIWKKVLKIINDLGPVSLPIIQNIASQLLLSSLNLQ